MKYLCMMLITFFLFPSSIIIAQSDDLAPINTLLDQAEIALDEGNLPTAQGLIIGANLLISKDMMTICPVLESAKSLLDQASTMPDVERTRSVLISARALIATCATHEVIATPDVPQNAYVITEQNVAQVTQLMQIGNGYVNHILYSPTGDTFAVWGMIGVWVYDATIPNATPFLLDTHPYSTRAVAYSPDGRYIATVAGAYDIYVWDIASRTIVQRFDFYSARQLVYNTEGTILLVRGEYWLRFFSVQTGAMLYELQWGEKKSVDVAYHPDGASIVLSFESETADVSIWTISDPRFGVGTEVSLLHQLPIPDNVEYSISNIEFSPDGIQLVGANYNYIGVIWDVATATITQTYLMGLSNIQFNPTGQNLLTWCSQCYMRVLSPQGELLQEFLIDYLLDATISADGNTILTLDNANSLNARIQHWNINTGELLQTRMGLDWHSLGEMKIAPNGETAAVIIKDQVVVYSLTSGERLMTLQTEILYSSYIAYSPDGRYLVHSSDTSQLTFWDATTGEMLNQFQVGHGALAFSPNSRNLAIGGDVVQIWDVESQAVVMRLEGFNNAVYYLAYSPDGRVIATADGSAIRLWDSQTGVSLGGLVGEHQDNVIALAFSPDSTHLVSSSWDSYTVVWDMTTYTATQLIGVDGARIYKLAYSPDGQMIVAGWGVGPIFVLDAETGIELYRLTGHREGLSGIGFNSDGTHLITGAYDDVIRVWGISSS